MYNSFDHTENGGDSAEVCDDGGGGGVATTTFRLPRRGPVELVLRGRPDVAAREPVEDIPGDETPAGAGDAGLTYVRACAHGEKFWDFDSNFD